MPGFFSLETGISKVDQQNHHHHHQDQDQDQEHEHDHHDDIISPYSLYLFKNKEIYNKGFELWQQYYQLHQQQQPPPTTHYGGSDRKKSTSTSSEGGSGEMRQGGYGISGGSSSSSGVMNCQDCGNQAKKDCQHMRCRTCCKSRGFQCQTHVKSTWVPASKRRERQQQLMSLTPQQNLGTQNLSLMMRAAGSGGGSDQNPKRLREVISGTGGGGGGGGGMGVNLPVAQHHNTSSGLQVGHFPAELSFPAVFRCVRVSAMNEAEEQLAYQTALNIGGHVFKGILYDHGPESRYMNHPGEGSSSGGGGGGAQLHDLITSGTTAASTATTSINQGVNFIDPSSRYPTPFSAFMAGTQFFPPPR